MAGIGSICGAWIVSLALIMLSALDVAYCAPVALDQNAPVVGPGKEILFSLSYSGSPTNFTILSTPAQGTLQSYNSRYNVTYMPSAYFFKAYMGYEGADSFIWHCSDASGSSGTATCTLRISSAPTAMNQAVTVATGGETGAFLLSHTDPMNDRLKTFTILGEPAHGSLKTYYEKYGTENPGYYIYSAVSGYVGGDSFTWKVNNGYADSGIGTASVIVTANTIPVANNYTSSVNSRTASQVLLSTTHPDIGQSLTYLLVSGTTHGVLCMPAAGSGLSYAAYRPDDDFVGTDSFTWRVSDGLSTSGIATATLIINTSTPVPQNQSAAAGRNMTTEVPALFTGGGGYSNVVVKASDPLHGILVVTNGTTFRYTPVTNYVGSDSFAWYVRYNGTGTTATATCSLMVKESSADWPTFRADEYRSGMTVMNLPEQLCLQWRRDLPAVSPAWSSTYLQWDIGPEPVVESNVLIVAVNNTDKIMAMDTANGAELWRFYADAPIRLAPVISGGRVFVVSDDGNFYCLGATGGQLLWKRRGAPLDRKAWANGRLSSVWVSRGGPMLADNTLYCTAGIWPTEGIFFYGLDPVNGGIRFLNDGLGALGTYEPHSNPGVSIDGPPVQGYLVMNGGNAGQFWMPTSRSEPALMNSSNARFLSWPRLKETNANSGPRVRADGTGGATQWPVSVTAGGKAYDASTAALLGVAGTTHTLIAADNKLFVTTRAGGIYCFGGNPVSNPPAILQADVPLPNIVDDWTSRVAQMLLSNGVADGVCTVVGTGTGRLTEELVRQASSALHILAVDPDTNKVAALRLKMDNARLYGNRVAALVGEPDNTGLPPYMARLLVSEDLAAAGWNKGVNFVTNIFERLNPYGGQAWLWTSDAEHSTLSGWIANAGLQAATLSRNGGFSVLCRTNLVGAVQSCDVPNNLNSPDDLVKGPFGVLWFDGAPYGSHGWSASLRAMEGVVDQTSVGIYDIYTGRALQGRSVTVATGTPVDKSSTYVNPLFGATGETHVTGPAYGYGCGDFDFFGYISTRRADTLAYYDHRTHGGQVGVGAIRGGCGSGGVPVNGVFLVPASGCGCAFSLTPSRVGLVPVPENEEWSYAGQGRTTLTCEDLHIRRIGLNFGAPADRLTPDGTLWLEYPHHADGGASPQIPVRSSPSWPTRNYHHNSRIRSIESGTHTWVCGSNVKGMTNLSLRLAWPAVATRCPVPPVLDGVLDDSCWDGRDDLRIQLDDAGWALYQATNRYGSVWLRYDDSSLYIAGSCLSAAGSVSGTWSIYLSSREMIGSNVTDGTETIRTAARLNISMPGQITSQALLKCGTPDVSWTGVWTGMCAGPAGANDGRNFEIRIPWATLASVGIWKENLMMNVFGPGNIKLRDFVYHPEMKYCPVYLDSARGRWAQPRNYTVKLHFAETEGVAAGQRVFDVKLQGNTVLPDFDIAGQAGALERGIVREFQNVVVTSDLNMDLVPKMGETLLSGLEAIQTSTDAANQPPVPVISASNAVGSTMILNSCVSRDPDGQIALVKWNFGDGDTAEGAYASHTYPGPGTYRVTMMISDDRGAISTASMDVQVTNRNVSDFVCRIRAAGGDYTNLSSWAAATKSSLTSTNSRLFDVTGINGYSPSVDDERAVTFTGGGTGVLKHVNLDGIAYIAACSNPAPGALTIAGSGHTLTVGDSGTPVTRAIAECYNDWTNGLHDLVTISGWVTDASHHVKIVPAAGHRHSGKPLAGGVYTGFALVGDSATQYALDVQQPYTTVSGMIVSGTNGVLLRGNHSCLQESILWRAHFHAYLNFMLANSMVIESPGDGISSGVEGSASDGWIHNVTVVNSAGRGYVGGPDDSYLRNVLIHGSGIKDIQSGSGTKASYCAIGDGSLAASAGTGNRTNRVFAFVDAANKDFHLAATDTGARGCGTNLIADVRYPIVCDIDCDARAGDFDIGADQCIGNRRPSAQNQFVWTPRNTAIPLALLANDPDGSALAWITTLNVANGTLTGEGPNRIYTPNADYHGWDAYKFKVNDGTNDSNEATVSIAVNSPPAAANIAATATEDTPKAITLTATDTDGDDLTWGYQQPVHGTVSGVGPDVVYTPAVLWHGTDSFVFVVNDPYDGSSTARVTVTVLHTNHAPVAYAQSLAASTNSPLTIILGGSDQDGDPLVFNVSGLPLHGTLMGSGSNRIYTSAGSYEGPDSLTFTVSDGNMESAPATVSIVVAAGPVPKKMKITFAGYDKSEPLTNFPALVVFSDNVAGSGFAYSQVVSSKGWDLRFNDQSGETNLNYEIESWNTNGSSYMWVQVPAMTNGSWIWATWGDVGVTSAPAVCTTNGATWAQGYQSVWHLNEPGAEVRVNSALDKYLTAVPRNFSGSEGVPGQAGGANHFNGALGQYVEVTNHSNPTAAITVECWAKSDTATWNQPGCLVSKRDAYIIHPAAGETTMKFYVNAGGWSSANGTPASPITGWHYYAGSYDGTAGRLWIDGVNVAAMGLPGSINGDSGVLEIGYDDGWAGRYFSGSIDEVRVSTISRSASWTWATWMNMASNTMFNQYGPVQSAGASAGVDAYGIPDVWKILHFGSATATNAGAMCDADGDGMANLAEYIAGTDPTNARGRLLMSGVTSQSDMFSLYFPTVTGRFYSVESSDELSTGGWLGLTSNVPGTGGDIQIEDHGLSSRRFYRIKVRLQ